jgi:hypothetical protein
MMPTQTKPRLEYLTIGVELDTGIIMDKTGSALEGSASADGLNKLERQVFAVGADIVRFDGRKYKKVEDEAMLGSSSGKPLRILSYELKR